MNKSPLRRDKDYIYRESDNFYFLVGRELYGFDDCLVVNLDTDYIHTQAVDSNYPCGVVITEPAERTKNNKGYRALVLVNGDDSDSDTGPRLSMVDDVAGLDMPITSFGCLARFYDDTGDFSTIMRKSATRTY